MTFSLWKYPIHFLAYGLGSGLMPILPGAFGSLVGVALCWLLAPLGAGAYAGIVAVVAITGIFICGQTARDLDAVDPGVIVWDEIAGFLVAMYLLPKNWRWLAAAFVLFRTFDGWKPYPISVIEQHLGGGLGIMADDIGAGILTLAILHLYQRVRQRSFFRS